MRQNLPHETRLLLACLAMAWLAWAAPAPAAGPVLEVAAGIPPVGYLLGRVGGPLARVVVLAGQGQSPHTFEPTPRQLAGLAGSRAYFSAGLPFEERLLAKARAANPGLQAVNTLEGITLMPGDEHHHEGPDHDAKADKDHGHEEGELDPHVWMSPRLAQVMTANIARALAALDPAHAADYERNRAALEADLRALDQRLGQALAPLKGRSFLVFHPAFGYLGRDYGLRQVAVETGGKEPGARRLAGLIDQAKAQGAKVIFVQPQFPGKSAQQVAQAIGGVVTPLDPLAADYLANLELVARRLAEGLSQAEKR